MSQLSCVKIHKKGCRSAEFVDYTANDALVNVDLVQSLAPVTPKNVDHTPGGDSDQKEYMVACANLPSPLVAISKDKWAHLGAGTVLAKSGGNLDGTPPHTAQQTPGSPGEEQTCLQHPLPPQNRTESITLHSQNDFTIAQELNSDMQALRVRRVACTWVKGFGAEAGEPGCVAHGEAHVSQVDWVGREEELDFLVDPS